MEGPTQFEAEHHQMKSNRNDASFWPMRSLNYGIRNEIYQPTKTMTKKNHTEKKIIDTEVFFSISIRACLAGNEK